MKLSNRDTLPLIVLALVTWTAGGASAQQVLYTFHGDSAWDWLGYSVSDAGDVNNDGYDDLIVGAPEDDNNGSDSGAARVYSGKNGTILYTFDGDVSSELGWSVSGAGDVNNDGYVDVVAGAPWKDGSARVYSGKDGAILYTFNGDLGNGDHFGKSVSEAGDVNNDGYDDLIVGVPEVGYNNDGAARVYSGKNGTVLYTFNGYVKNLFLGWSVSGGGDVNNDGYDDVVAGGPFAYIGSARVYSGKDGSTLFTFHGDTSSQEFGHSVSGAGDVNNDGYDDLIVGAPGDSTNGVQSGLARTYSGKDGSILYTFHGDSAWDWLGHSVSGAGDVNKDGYDDLIAGAPRDDNNGSDSGSARAYSGKDGSILFTLIGDSEKDHLGSSVSRAGDVNADGFTDLIAGAHDADNNGSSSGSARVYSGACGIVTTYGAGCPGTGGFVPDLAFTGCLAGGEQVTLNLTKGLGGSLAVVLISAGQASAPLAFGCTMLVQSTPLSVILPLGGSGAGGGSISLPTVLAPPVPPGTAYLQAFVADTAFPIGLSATNGLKVQIW